MQLNSISKVYGCGALNWDAFFEIESLEELRILSPDIAPGRELVLKREDFETLERYLSKKGFFLFECGGGSAANTIYALATWGFQAGFLGALGEDEPGEKILKEFSDKGVDVRFIFKSGTTSRAVIVLDKKRDRFIAVCPGNSENYLNTLDFEVFKELGEDRVLLHLASFASTAGEEFQKRLLNTFFSSVSFDPGEVYCRKGKGFLESWLKCVKLLFITEEELDFLGMNERELVSTGLECIFLKLGKRGAKAFFEGSEIFISAVEVESPVDNTGAGDYFDAGVIAGLKLGFSIEDALRLGVFCAAKSLANYGRAGCISEKEFKNYLNLLK